MLRLLPVVAFCILTTGARAQETHVVPAAGATLTYRMLTTTKMDDKTIVVGQIYTYVVASSDGATAEGAIKPVALLFDCRGHEEEGDCVSAKKAPNVREEDGLTVVPVAAAVGDALARKSAFKLHAFIFEQRRAAIPSPSGVGQGEFFNVDDPLIIENDMICDAVTLMGLTPFGKTPGATMPCQYSFQRSGGGLSAISQNSSFTIVASYEGDGHITLPSGDWNVQKLLLRMNLPPSPSGSPTSQTEIQFSDTLGVAVETHSRVELLNKTVTETDSELIAVSPR